ncbi:hypothetical protein FE391_23590 [Nonomuraea sp. KC401]|uniref:hypothetical protein n=1 Tax=unclassified Nonomuraea TaxID=2593643 RepID=UPI0010FD97BD|nr:MULTISPECIES: hypothetical protein [unclassified Nonomuraea]NBE96834.1 hypothetical protein [Nonomuraea sp. K271]TLF68031.1 hypothetical protein FE391_23590 [Nonomuraea sp. KC401]
MRKTIVAALAGGALLATGTPASAQTAGAEAVHAVRAAKTRLGPYGYGRVKLAMSAKKARATGRVVLKTPLRGGACSGWDLKAHPSGKNRVGLYVSKRRGVAVIFAPKGVRTPEGIGIGSTTKQVKKAYPRWQTAASGFLLASVPGNKKAYYSFITSKKGEVRELALGLDTQDCVN